MQEENQNFSEFFERTRALADKLGIAVVDLPDVIGISKAMLFAYRKGKYPISWKAWRKLEAAEEAAGASNKQDVIPTAIIHEEPDGEYVPPECPAGISRLESMMAAMLARMDRMEAELKRLKR